MSAVLSFEDVRVRFAADHGGVASPAVDGITMQVNRGEIFGVVGESGSGKSTLANAVLGLLPRSASVSGRITVDGRQVIGLSEDQLRRMRGNQVSMIFQDASVSLDPTWPVGEQIAETVRAHQSVGRRAARARAIELMSEVGIPEPTSRYRDAPHRFSGGMRQRVVIAAALANNPQILIADEPTTALDVTIQAQVLKLVDALRHNHGTTVVLITHDLGVVSQVCDRVGVMYRGKLLETGNTREVFAAPTHPYTRALMAANPAWARRGTRLPVVPPEWSVESLQQSQMRRPNGGGAA